MQKCAPVEMSTERPSAPVQEEEEEGGGGGGGEGGGGEGGGEKNDMNMWKSSTEASFRLAE